MELSTILVSHFCKKARWGLDWLASLTKSGRTFQCQSRQRITLPTRATSCLDASALAKPMLVQKVAHARQSEELLAIVGNERVQQRLQQLLVWLARKFGR